MIENTEMSGSSFAIPTEECFDENGKIKKEVYMRQFPDFTKHEKKMTKKKLFKLLEKNPRNKHYRLEIHQTSFGCNFYFTGENYVPTEAQKNRFVKEVWDAIDSCVVNVKAFDFNTKDNYDSIEIWGINDQDESVILFLYVYDKGVIEIGEYDE